MRKIVDDNMPLITKAMEDDEDNLTKKFADGGMTVTEDRPQDIEDGQRRSSPAYWDEWAKSKGPDAVSRAEAGSRRARPLDHVRSSGESMADGRRRPSHRDADCRVRA